VEKARCTMGCDYFVMEKAKLEVICMSCCDLEQEVAEVVEGLLKEMLVRPLE